MYNRHPIRSRLVKALLIGGYFVLFAVHLHLRYALLPVFTNGKTTTTYAYQHPSKQCKVPGEKLQAKKAEVKLNKRFLPQQVYESLPGINMAPAAYVLVHVVYPITTPALCSTPTDHFYLRGPPAGA